MWLWLWDASRHPFEYVCCLGMQLRSSAHCDDLGKRGPMGGDGFGEDAYLINSLDSCEAGKKAYEEEGGEWFDEHSAIFSIRHTSTKYAVPFPLPIHFSSLPSSSLSIPGLRGATQHTIDDDLSQRDSRRALVRLRRPGPRPARPSNHRQTHSHGFGQFAHNCHRHQCLATIGTHFNTINLSRHDV